MSREKKTQEKYNSMTNLLRKTYAYQETARFKMAMAKIPTYEVSDTRRLIGPDAKHMADDEIRYIRAVNRYENPICCNPTCGVPERGKRRQFSSLHTKTLWCSCCFIVAYCSRECQVAHRPVHRVWSKALPDAPRPASVDPMGPIVVDLETHSARRIDESGNLVDGGTLFIDKES